MVSSSSQEIEELEEGLEDEEDNEDAGHNENINVDESKYDTGSIKVVPTRQPEEFILPLEQPEIPSPIPVPFQRVIRTSNSAPSTLQRLQLSHLLLLKRLILVR